MTDLFIGGILMENKSYPVIDVVATGENIVRLRRQHGVSVSELQRFLGFEAPQAIYKWQQGKCLPSTDNLYALSYFLEVPIEKILVPKFQVLPQDESCGSPFFWEEIRRFPGISNIAGMDIFMETAFPVLLHGKRITFIEWQPDILCSL